MKKEPRMMRAQAKHRKTPAELLREPYSRVLVPDTNGGFSAEILEFPGCVSQGETAAEAYERLEAAAESWLEAALAQGMEIPRPATRPEATSGKFLLRLPRSLQYRCVRLAEAEGVSLNTFLVSAVGQAVGAITALSRVEARVCALAVAGSNSTNQGRHVFPSLTPVPEKSMMGATSGRQPNRVQYVQ